MSLSPHFPQPDPAPLGEYKQFGLYGPVYQLMSEPEPANGERMIPIQLVQTGGASVLPTSPSTTGLDLSTAQPGGITPGASLMPTRTFEQESDFNSDT